MGKKVKITKIEKILLGLTAAFLCTLAVLWALEWPAQIVQHAEIEADGGEPSAQEQEDSEQDPGSNAEEDAPDSGLIDLNQADAQTLETLPGIGEVLAQRIVEYRTANGPFQSVEELLQVSGIGESKLAAIRDAITVG